MASPQRGLDSHRLIPHESESWTQRLEADRYVARSSAGRCQDVVPALAVPNRAGRRNDASGFLPISPHAAEGSCWRPAN